MQKAKRKNKIVYKDYPLSSGCFYYKEIKENEDGGLEDLDEIFPLEYPYVVREVETG